MPASTKRGWLACAPRNPLTTLTLLGSPCMVVFSIMPGQPQCGLQRSGFSLLACCIMVADGWCSLGAARGLADSEIGSNRARWICRVRVRRGGLGLSVGKAAVTQSCGPLWQPGRAWPAQVTWLRPGCEGRRAKTMSRGVATRWISVGNIAVWGVGTVGRVRSTATCCRLAGQ